MPEMMFWQICLLAAGTGTLALFWPVAALATWGTGIVAFWRRLNLLRLCCLILSFAAGYGAAWLSFSPPGPSTFSPPSAPVLIEGRVSGLDDAPNGVRRIYLADTRLPEAEGLKLPGHVVWYTVPGTPAILGQTVQASVRLSPVRGFANEQGFNAARHWGLRNVWYRASTPYRTEMAPRFSGSGKWWSRWRNTLLEKVRSILTEIARERDGNVSPGLGLMAALILGVRSLMRWSDLELFSKAGLSHSIALSGLHLGFMVLLGCWGIGLAGRLQPRMFLLMPRPLWIACLGLPLVAVYLWLGNFPPTLVRAAAMFAVCALALLLRRRMRLQDALFFALLVLFCSNPLSFYDIGIQLSFLAVFALALCADLTRRLQAFLGIKGCSSRLERIFRAALWTLILSFFIQFASWPFLAFYFGHATPWTFLNVLWIPLVGCFVFPCALLGVIFSASGVNAGAAFLFRMAAWPADMLFQFLEWLEGHSLLASWAVVRPDWAAMLGFYALAGVFLIRLRRKRNLPLALAALILWTISLGGRIAAEQPDMARMVAYDVGHGQAVLIEAPGNVRVLIDGGGRNMGQDPGKAVLLPSLSANRGLGLKALVNTHQDVDHVRGLLHIMEQMDIETACFNEPPSSASKDGQGIERILKRKGLLPRILKRGDILPLSDDLDLEILHPAEADRQRGKRNNYSLVVRVREKKTGRGLALIPGDIEKEGIKDILRAGLDISAQVLILPHHGSAASFSSAFYDAVSPQIAVAFCGYRNRWGFPSKAVRDELRRRGIRLVTTAEHGQLTFSWRKGESAPDVVSFLGAP